jgi:pyruvate,water dikinase
VSRDLLRIDRIAPRRGAEFGGKARGLSALARGGFPVPPAFALSFRASEHHFARALDEREMPREIFAAREVSAQRLEAIAEKVRRAPLGEHVAADLREALAELSRDGAVGVAVRSSSTHEDDAGATAAGMHASLLHVTGEAALDDAVRACWAGLFSLRVWSYLRASRAEGPPSMGVVIQAMVPAEAAGVMFTVNPLTGDAGEIVLNASYGLGAAVVDGKVSPDTYRVDKATRGYRDRILGQKAVEVVLAEPGGVRERAVEAARRGELCLTQAQVDALTEHALRVERHFGGPQDVEFAVRGDEVWLLQARPLAATLQPATKRWHRRRAGAIDRRKLVWSNVNVGEALPGVATPLTWSVLSHFSELGFRRAFGALGLSVPPEAELVGDFRGRIYLNLTELLGALSQVPGFRPSMVLALGGGGLEGVLDAEAEPRGSASFVARLPWTVKRFASENFRLAARVRAFDAEFAAERRRLGRLDLRILPPAALAQTLKDTEHLLDRTGAIMLTVYGDLLGASVALSLALKAFSSEQAEGIARDLLAGLEDVDSAAPGLALTRVGEALARDPSAAALIASREAAALRVDALPEGPTRRALEHFVRAYGHRGPREAELAEARWGEDPTTLFATLQVHLRKPGGVQVAATEARRARVRHDAERRLKAVVPLPLRPAIRQLLALVQRFMRMRERLRSHVTDVLGLMRGVALDVSRRIEVREPAAGGDAAFFLTIDELHQVLRGELLRVGVRVQQRRVQYERDRALPDPPDTFVGYPPPVAPPPPDTRRLAGLAASAGVAQGAVRVLREARDAVRFQPGEVLVAPVADVGWSPLFLTAAAVVTDLGGPLSHASIVLREYGVPAVVNVKDATSILRDGERVRVDGYSGEVRRLDVLPGRAAGAGDARPIDE